MLMQVRYACVRVWIGHGKLNGRTGRTTCVHTRSLCVTVPPAGLQLGMRSNCGLSGDRPPTSARITRGPIKGIGLSVTHMAPVAPTAVGDADGPAAAGAARSWVRGHHPCLRRRRHRGWRT